MNLTEWARAQGVHPQTAYRWFREGTLPVPAVRVTASGIPKAAGIEAILRLDEARVGCIPVRS